VIKNSQLDREYGESVATTWYISFERVKQQFAAAAELLKLCAYFAPEAIPEAIVLKGADKLSLSTTVGVKGWIQQVGACNDRLWPPPDDDGGTATRKAPGCG
jgi:hypothetical protein